MKFLVSAIVILALACRLDCAPVDQVVFLRKMHEFAAQSFDEYEINLRIETVDKEFDYRKIPGCTSDSTAHLVSLATEYKQGDRYTIRMQIPLDNVDIQTHYWTGSEAFVANQTGANIKCKKVRPSQIFISLSTVFNELGKSEFYNFNNLKDIRNERFVYWSHPGLLASGWIKMDASQFPDFDITIQDPEGDYRFYELTFKRDTSFPHDIFNLPSQCRR